MFGQKLFTGRYRQMKSNKQLWKERNAAGITKTDLANSVERAAFEAKIEENAEHEARQQAKKARNTSGKKKAAKKSEPETEPEA